MPGFKFYWPIEVRYGDLDPQGHVNNACYLTYFQEGRIAYIQDLGLWDGRSFLDVGIILAEARVTFKAPILFGQPVQTGVRVSKLGNKSLTMEYRLEDIRTGQELATGSAVLVTYDYRLQATIPVPEHWRQTIQAFEDLIA
jgi:acyl-CoA thioester hydrolase